MKENLFLTDAQLRAELMRCEYCEERPCQAACPALTNIPAYIRMITEQRLGIRDRCQPVDVVPRRLCAIILGARDRSGSAGNRHQHGRKQRSASDGAHSTTAGSSAASDDRAAASAASWRAFSSASSRACSAKARSFASSAARASFSASSCWRCSSPRLT